MAKKKPSLKGKGADIFLSKEDTPSRSRKRTTGETKKATFYVPEGLLNELDDAWLDMRRIQRDVTKSELVAVALEAALTDYAKRQEESHLQQTVLGDSPKEAS